jgi:hypothetical protein
MSYDDTGTFVGPDFIAAEFVHYRDTALAHAEPFPEWSAKYGG